jgi:pimeloyl-ACP methyl ester carboxylesterase
MMKRMLVAWLVGVLWSLPGLAAEITETLPNGMRVTADYRPAVVDAPSLLILHGFLATSGFPAVQSLMAEFSAKGYSVLAPTLSLGVSKRRAGLACDAIQMHTQDDDQAEIHFWVDWLAQHSKGAIVLVGHSFGSVQLLDYVMHAPNPRVVGLVGVSLSYVGAAGEELLPTQFTRAQAQKLAGDWGLGRYNLIFCHGNYTSTAEGYLSYANLGRAYVLESLNKKSVPLIAIMGGADQRFAGEWVQDMRHAGVDVQLVPGASHFFDGSFEFDLLEAVSRALAAMKVRP